jgi:hypothetical protein
MSSQILLAVCIVILACMIHEMRARVRKLEEDHKKFKRKVFNFILSVTQDNSSMPFADDDFDEWLELLTPSKDSTKPD